MRYFTGKVESVYGITKRGANPRLPIVVFGKEDSVNYISATISLSSTLHQSLGKKKSHTWNSLLELLNGILRFLGMA